jgi:acetyl esterase/lipase
MQISQISIPSSFDGAEQRMVYYEALGKSRPLLVALHTWSYDYTQESSAEYFKRAASRDWHCIFPDFRGPNRTPLSCGSQAALRDIHDAVSWAMNHFSVDSRRIYLAGVSGGGHMALLAAANLPSAWTAVSAWVPISDLARWHRECTERGLEYAAEMEAICGGSPGTSKKVDNEYTCRSSISSLWRAHIIPVDINAGIHDGHGGKLGKEGSVPVGQSIRAYNELVKASGGAKYIVPECAINDIERDEKVPKWFEKIVTEDSAYGRSIHLRRTHSLARLTLFEGGHEILYDAVFMWFERF